MFLNTTCPEIRIHRIMILIIMLFVQIFYMFMLPSEGTCFMLHFYDFCEWKTSLFRCHIHVMVFLKGGKRICCIWTKVTKLNIVLCGMILFILRYTYISYLMMNWCNDIDTLLHWDMNNVYMNSKSCLKIVGVMTLCRQLQTPPLKMLCGHISKFCKNFKFGSKV